MRHSRGFTLIEILVVMALLLIVVGVAVVRLDDSGERITRSMPEQLAIKLEAARDEAVYSGKQVAFSSDGAGYQFWTGDALRHQWFAIAGSGELQPQTLKGDVRLLEQSVNGRPRPLGERLSFSADGLSEPFSLLLQGGSKRLRVVADALGRISIQEIASDAP